MYSADLSRLPGFVPQIVAELFTLLFDLVCVGGQAVGIYAAKPGTPSSLGFLARCHRDLLHYLRDRPALLAEDAKRESQERAKCAEGNSPDALAQLGGALAAVEIDLLTVGCPLRQLYAQRFPAQYAWGLRPQARTARRATLVQRLGGSRRRGALAVEQ